MVNHASVPTELTDHFCQTHFSVHEKRNERYKRLKVEKTGIPEKEKEEGVGEGKGTRIREDKGHGTREGGREERVGEEAWRMGNWPEEPRG